MSAPFLSAPSASASPTKAPGRPALKPSAGARSVWTFGDFVVLLLSALALFFAVVGVLLALG